MGSRPSSDFDLQAPLVGETAKIHDAETLNTMETVFNLANTVIGVGVLSVPYAFRLSGYSSMVLLVIVIAVCSYTGKLVGRALRLAQDTPAAEGVPPRGRDFAFLAFVAFGEAGRWVIGAVTTLEVWFALTTFLVMNGVNAELLWPGIGTSSAVVVSTLLTGAMLVCLPMKVYSYVSLVSSASLCIAALALVGSAMMMESWSNPYEHLGGEALLTLSNVPRSTGILVFCFAGHPCFPVIHESMRERRTWSFAIDVTFVLALVYYGSFGVFGYLVFGPMLDEAITTNLASVPGAVLWRQAALLAFTVKIQLTAPLLLNAILVTVSPPRADAEWPLRRLVILAVLLAATMAVAICFGSHIGVLASLTGSLFTMTTSVLFPASVYAALSWHRLDVVSLLCLAVILTFGSVMAVTGTVLAVSDVVR